MFFLYGGISLTVCQTYYGFECIHPFSPTGTHTRTTRPPNEHLPQALNNAQQWRDDGAYHLPRRVGDGHVRLSSSQIDSRTRSLVHL